MKRILFLFLMIAALVPVHAQVDTSYLQAGQISVLEVPDQEIHELLNDEIGQYEYSDTIIDDEFFLYWDSIMYEPDSLSVDTIAYYLYIDTIEEEPVIIEELDNNPAVAKKNVDLVLVVEQSKYMSSYYTSLSTMLSRLKRYCDTNALLLRVALVTYGDESLSALDLTTKLAKVQEQLRSNGGCQEIPPVHGVTRMYDALRQAIFILELQGKGQKLIWHVGGSGNVNKGAEYNAWKEIPAQLGTTIREKNIKYGAFQAYNVGDFANLSFVSQTAMIVAFRDKIINVMDVTSRDTYLKDKQKRSSKELTNIIFNWTMKQLPAQVKKTKEKATGYKDEIETNVVKDSTAKSTPTKATKKKSTSKKGSKGKKAKQEAPKAQDTLKPLIKPSYRI